MRRVTVLGLVVAGLMALSLTAYAGVSGPSFYVDGELYRTVGTPTDFSGTGAPDHSFDTIYAFGDLQDHNVATAAPGDVGFNGGRWRVEAIAVVDGTYGDALAVYDTNFSGDFDSAAEVEAAISDGVFGTSVVRSFECPVIPVPRGR